MYRINSYIIQFSLVCLVLVSGLEVIGQSEGGPNGSNVLVLDTGNYDFATFKKNSESLGLGVLILQEIESVQGTQRNNQAKLEDQFRKNLKDPIGSVAHVQLVLYTSKYAKQIDAEDPFLTGLEEEKDIPLTDDFYVYIYCTDKVEVRFLEQKLKNLGQDLHKIAPNSYALGSKKGSCKIQGEEGNLKLYSALVELSGKHAQNLAGKNSIKLETQSNRLDNQQALLDSIARTTNEEIKKIKEELISKNALRIQFGFGGTSSDSEDYFSSLSSSQGAISFRSAEFSINYFRGLDMLDDNFRPFVGMGIGFSKNYSRIDLKSATYEYEGLDAAGNECLKIIRFKDFIESYQSSSLFLELNAGINKRDKSDKHELFFLTGLRFNVTDPIRTYISRGKISTSGIYATRPNEIENISSLGYISDQNALSQQYSLDTKAFTFALNMELGYGYFISDDFKLNLGLGLNIQNDFVNENPMDFGSQWEDLQFNSFSNLRESRSIAFLDFSFGFSILL
jgi:hypothetical protein